MSEDCRELVGSLLRLKREELNYSISEISAILKVRSLYLGKLEEGKLDEEVDIIYQIGYLKLYSNFLRLDSSELIKMYKPENKAKIVPKKHFPVPEIHFRKFIPSKLIISLSSIFVFLYASIWLGIAKIDAVQKEVTYELRNDDFSYFNSDYDENDIDDISSINNEYILLSETENHVKIFDERNTLLNEIILEKGETFFINKNISYLIAKNPNYIELYKTNGAVLPANSIPIRSF